MQSNQICKKVNTCWPVWHAAGDDLCSQFRIPNRKHKWHSETDSDRRYLRDDHKEETQHRYVLNHIHECMLQNRGPVLPSLLRPSVCPATRYRKLWFFLRRKKRTTINPYNLLLLSETHCTHSPAPSSSCSQSGYGGEHKAHSVYPWCTYIDYTCRVPMQHAEQSSDNREPTKFFFF